MCFPINLKKEAKFSQIKKNLYRAPSTGFWNHSNFVKKNLYPLPGSVREFIKKIIMKMSHWKSKQITGLCFAIQP